MAVARNRCGSCQVCCIVLPIKDLEKPAGQNCRHLCKQGCDIYNARPVACRTFNCTWLLSGWEKKHRPDRLGMLFMYHPDKGLVAKELEKGAHRRKEIVKLLKRLKREMPVTLQIQK